MFFLTQLHQLTFTGEIKLWVKVFGVGEKGGEAVWEIVISGREKEHFRMNTRIRKKSVKWK